MGSASTIMTGARAQLIINGKVVGIFTNCSYGVTYDAQPAFILGRFSPAEITYTAQEAISVTASGFRVVDNGAYKAAALPKLQELLNAEDISLSIFDRKTQKNIMTVVGVRPLGFDSSNAARAMTEFSARFLGLRLEDESGAQGEAPGASDLSSGS